MGTTTHRCLCGCLQPLHMRQLMVRLLCVPKRDHRVGRLTIKHNDAMSSLFSINIISGWATGQPGLGHEALGARMSVAQIAWTMPLPLAVGTLVYESRSVYEFTRL